MSYLRYVKDFDDSEKQIRYITVTNRHIVVNPMDEELGVKGVEFFTLIIVGNDVSRYFSWFTFTKYGTDRMLFVSYLPSIIM